MQTSTILYDLVNVREPTRQILLPISCTLPASPPDLAHLTHQEEPPPIWLASTNGSNNGNS